MAINIKFDSVGNPELPTLILATRGGKKLGQLDASKIELNDKFIDAPEISFVVYKYKDYKITNLWDKIVDFKLIYCKEWDLWFEIKVELDEETETVKTVFGKQLGQSELSQIMLYNVEINTENDIARDDYKITVLYSRDSEASLLNRILDKAPHYSIKHVDATIANIQRTFTFDGTSVYDAFLEIAEEIGCLFVFHSNSDENGKPIRSISVYDLEQNCLNNNCNYRGEFTDVCPNCGETNIMYGYGEDTSIFVTSDELATNGIQLVADVDSLKNCFKLEAGDDLMTATVRNCNPNGTDYIWRISDFMKEDMSNELVNKLESYDVIYKEYYNDRVYSLDTNLLNQYNSIVDKYLTSNDKLERIVTPVIGFHSLMNAYYNVVDLSLYLESSMMPEVDLSKTNARLQAALITSTALSPTAVANVGSTSLATSNSAILAMAKTLVKSGYKVEVNTSELTDRADGNKTWKGNFIITNYSDENDTATSSTMSVVISGDNKTFISQKLDKALYRENTDDLSISGLFKMGYDSFCKELKRYALNPLIRFHDACQACLDILVEQGVASKNTFGNTNTGSNSNLYEELYVPYYNKLKAIESEMKIREDEINVVLGIYDSNGNLTKDGLGSCIEKNKEKVQDTLNFEKYLGTNLWFEFCSYRREDKYLNDNYISDGLDNAELFKRAMEFVEVAQNEIYKSSELQFSITATLNNLLAIDKFKPLIKSFETGNWIRVQIDDCIYKLRLLDYDINYDDFNTIPVVFSNVSKIKNGITDVKDILSQASSMATSYDSVKRQAKQGDEARGTIEKWLASGLNSALVQIRSNDTEDITIDKNGLLCRSYDDITDSYSPKQLKLTHNIIAYTDDDWESVRQAIGEHNYMYYDNGKDEFVNTIGYGVSADFLTAGVVTGSQIIGGDIYSDNYSKLDSTGSYINLRDGTFSFGGGSLRFEGGNLLISSPDIPSTEQITEINEEYIKTTSVYAENLQVSAINVNGKIVADQIDARELKVDAANITGTLTIGQLGSDVIPSKVSQLENDSGYQNSTQVTTITNNTISTTNVTATNLKVKAANIDGTLTANQIDANNLKVKAANVEGVLTADKIDAKNLEVDALKVKGEFRTDQIDSAAIQIIDGRVTTDYINALNITAGSVDAENITGTTITGKNIVGGSLNIGNGNFVVTSAGTMTAKNGDFTGKITASSGKIGGWTIGDNDLYFGNDYSNSKMGMGTASSDWAFWAGYSNGDAAFRVTANGKLYATDAKVTGEITASSGSITGNLNVSGSITNTNGDYGVTLRAVQSNTSYGVFYITDKSSGSNVYPFIVNGDGSFKATKATITGNSTFGGTLSGVSGTFTSLSAGKSTFKTNQIIIDASYKDSNGQEISKGSIYIGRSGVEGWEDITIRPSSDNLGNIGTSGKSWDMLYVKNGAVSSSDRNYKKDISVMGEKQERFFNLLTPVTFKFIDSTYDRFHYGFISQEVEDAIIESGLTTKDFAGFCKEVKRDENGDFVLDEDGNEMYTYALRYNEFIALNTHMIQKMQKENKELKERVDSLENMLMQLS